jgi:hypothetical protein
MIEKIVSGGQTGADRAALDFAIERNIPHGGWCPKGRRAEDGAIPAPYVLQETPKAGYLKCTDWNVRDSDGTVIFTLAAELNGGSKRTVDFASLHNKPCYHLSQTNGVEVCVAQLKEAVARHEIRTLNVTGPCGSEEPRIAAFVRAVLTLALL